MKLNKTIKITVISIVVVIAVIALSGYVYIKTGLEPKDIESYSKGKIEELIPDSVVRMGAVDFSLKTSLVLAVKNFSLTRVIGQEEVKLFSTSRLRIEVPLSSILLGGGNIDIRLTEPQLTVGSNSWQVKAPQLTHTKKKVSSETKILIPSFIASSTFDIRGNELKIQVNDKQKREHPFSIDKFVLKNFGLTSNAAFELRTKVSTNPFGKKLSFFLTNLGSFSISNYLKTGLFAISSSYKIQDVVLDKSLALSKVIHGGLTASLGPSGEVIGTVTSLAERSRVESNYSWSGKTISLTKIRGDLVFSDFLEILPVNSAFDFSTTGLKVDGAIDFDSSEYRPDLNFSLNSLIQKISNNKISHSASGQLKKDRLNFDLNSKGFGGQMKGDFTTSYSLMSSAPIEKRIKNYEGKINIDGVTIDQDIYKVFRSYFHNSFSVPEGGVLLPEGKVGLKVENSRFKSMPLSLEGKIVTKANKLFYQDFIFTSDSGQLILQKKKTFYRDDIFESFNLKIKNFRLETLFSVYPGSRPSLAGRATGQYIYKKEEKDSFSIDINIKKGRFLNLNFSDELLNLKSVFATIPSVAAGLGQGVPVVENEFSAMKVQANMKQGILKVDNFSLISPKGMLLLEGSGSLREDGPQYLAMKMKDEFGFSRKWKKLTGSQVIPLKASLTSKGVLFNETFTVEKLATGILKKRGRKGAQNLLKEEKVALIKLFGVKKMKKLLKGIYK